jgi:hypothetical protein
MANKTKRPVTIKFVADVSTGTLQIRQFDNIKKDFVGEALHCAANKIDPRFSTLNVKGKNAFILGLTNTIRDAGAMSDATVKQRHDSMSERVLFLESNAEEWGQRSNRGISEQSLLVKALARAYPAKTTDEIVAIVSARRETAKTKQETWPNVVAKMLRDPRIVEHVAAIRAEEAEDVDEDAMFSELDAE